MTAIEVSGRGSFRPTTTIQLDTSALEAGTSPGGGRPGYGPQMLATLVMYAMSCGVRSSREIEDRTRVA